MNACILFCKHTYECLRVCTCVYAYGRERTCSHRCVVRVRTVVFAYVTAVYAYETMCTPTYARVSKFSHVSPLLRMRCSVIACVTLYTHASLSFRMSNSFYATPGSRSVISRFTCSTLFSFASPRFPTLYSVFRMRFCMRRPVFEYVTTLAHASPRKRVRQPVLACVAPFSHASPHASFCYSMHRPVSACNSR